MIDPESHELYHELSALEAGDVQRAADIAEALQHLICSEPYPQVLRLLALLKLIRSGVISLEQAIASAEEHIDHSAEEEE